MEKDRLNNEKRCQQEQKRNETCYKIYLDVAQIHAGLRAFLKDNINNTLVCDETSSEESSYVEELHIQVHDRLEELNRSPFSRSIEQIHLDTNRYYAMMHSKGHELSVMLHMLPDNIFMRFIGERNNSLLLVDYSTLRSLHAVRLSILLTQPNLGDAEISSVMNSSKSILKTYDDILDSNKQKTILIEKENLAPMPVSKNVDNAVTKQEIMLQPDNSDILFM